MTRRGMVASCLPSSLTFRYPHRRRRTFSARRACLTDTLSNQAQASASGVATAMRPIQYNSLHATLQYVAPYCLFRS